MARKKASERYAAGERVVSSAKTYRIQPKHTYAATFLFFDLVFRPSSQLPVDEKDLLLFVIHNKVTGMDIAMEKASIVNRLKDMDQLSAISKAVRERHVAVLKHFRSKWDASRTSHKTGPMHGALGSDEPWDLNICMLYERVNKMETKLMRAPLFKAFRALASRCMRSLASASTTLMAKNSSLQRAL
jgi:hypothetical protein